MVWITVKKGVDTLSEHEFSGGEVLIGRDPNCDLVLESEEVSRKHARIVISDEGLKLIDIQSTNGTFLNGKRISEAELSFGDIINILNFSIVLKKGSETAVIDRSPAKRKIGELADLDPEKAGECIDITINFSIGRDPQCDMVLSSEDVSWQHASIELDKERPVIIDNETRNGTKVNDKIISGMKALFNGDRISIGDHHWVFKTELAKREAQQETPGDKRILSKPIYKIMAAVGIVLLLAAIFFPKDQNDQVSIHGLIEQADRLEKDGQYESALKILRRGYEIAPDNQTIIFKINQVSEKVEIEKEVRRIKLMLEADDIPTLLEVESMLSQLMEKQSDHSELESLLALTRKKLNNQKLSEEVYGLLQEGRYKECIDLLQIADHPMRDNYLIEANKGRARQLEIQGSYKKAQDVWQSVLALDENDPDAEEAIKRLKNLASISPPQKTERKKSVTSVPAATKIKKPAREVTPSQTSSQKGKPVSTEGKIEQPQMEASEEGDKEVLITEGQKKEAEEIYWAAYRRMQYKNKKSYQEALTMFEKVVKLVPDNSFEFTAKAKEKIEQIQQKLDNL